MDSAVPFSNAVFDVPPFPEQAHIMTVAAAIHTFNILVIIIHLSVFRLQRYEKRSNKQKNPLNTFVFLLTYLYLCTIKDNMYTDEY